MYLLKKKPIIATSSFDIILTLSNKKSKVGRLVDNLYSKYLGRYLTDPITDITKKCHINILKYSHNLCKFFVDV